MRDAAQRLRVIVPGDCDHGADTSLNRVPVGVKIRRYLRVEPFGDKGKVFRMRTDQTDRVRGVEEAVVISRDTEMVKRVYFL